MDELADTAMQEAWNTWLGDDHRLVRAEENDGAAPVLLHIDELCPVGSTFRGELVACLAEMFREFQTASMSEGKARNESCKGTLETGGRTLTVLEEQPRTTSRNGARDRQGEACPPVVDPGSSVPSTVTDGA